MTTNISADGPAPTAWRRREVKTSVSWAGLSASLGRWGEESPPLVQRLLAAAEGGVYTQPCDEVADTSAERRPLVGLVSVWRRPHAELAEAMARWLGEAGW